MDTIYSLAVLPLDHSPQVSVVIPPTEALGDQPTEIGIEARYINLDGGDTFVVRYKVSLKNLLSEEEGEHMLNEFRRSADHLVAVELRDRILAKDTKL